MKKLILTITMCFLFAVALIILGRLATGGTDLDAKLDIAPPRHTASRKLIIVGEEWAPFEYSKDGVTRGIDAEILELVFGKLGVDYEIQFYPWSRAWLMAQNGEADAVISISYKKERETHLLYTDSQKRFGETGDWPADYLWGSEYVFFIRKIHEPVFTFNSYVQIKADKYRVATIQDYSYDKKFMEAGMNSQVVPDQEAGFQLLAEGKADIFPNEKTVGLVALQKLGLTDKITYCKKPMFRKPYLLPFCRKSDYPDKEKLMMQFYAALRKLRASGEYQRIYEKNIKAMVPDSPK